MTKKAEAFTEERFREILKEAGFSQFRIDSLCETMNNTIKDWSILGEAETKQTATDYMMAKPEWCHQES